LPNNRALTSTPFVKALSPIESGTEEICVSIQVIFNTNAIVTLFPAGQFSAPFDFAQGVPSNVPRVFGSMVVINALKNTDENRQPYTESPIRLKIAAVSAEIKCARFGVIFFVEISPNYFSIAAVTFRIALIQKSYHGVSSFTDKYFARTCLPKLSQMRLMVLSLTLKECNLLK
jgi:hypothetical protein